MFTPGTRPARADDVGGNGQQEISFQYSGFDPEQFLASADPEQIGLMDGARTQTMGTYAVGMLFHYAGPPLDICVKDGNDPGSGCKVVGDILNSRLRADLGVLYGLGRFDLRLALPLVLHQSTDFAPQVNQDPLGSAGVGNPKVSGRVQLLRPGDFDIAFDLGVSIPTGQANFIGDEGIIVDPRLLVDWRHGPISLGLDGGYQYRQDSAKVANLYVDDEIVWSAAGQYQVLPHKLAVGLAAYGRLGLMSAPLDLSEQMHVISKLGPEEFPAEILASGQYMITKQLALDIGGGTGLTQGYGAAPYRVIAGVRLIQQKEERHTPGEISHHRGPDRDHDGIPDEDDQCAKDPEDMDGFQDTDGCPETDNDEDGILDADDKCPLAAEDKDGFEDADGCPDYDNDGDGVSDDEDKCPNEAEDMDGFQDDDGCPDLDADQDGVADADDQCPTDAGDAAHHGCPSHDTDGDGIDDASDACPDDPETVNSVEDNDGCPDATFEVVFDKARVRSASHAAMKAMAASLKARGDVHVRIEGHTKDADQKLNQERAESVKSFLVKEGVAASRLEAKGFPPSDDASGMVFIILGNNPGAGHPGGEVEPTPTPTPAPAPAPAPTPTPTPPAPTPTPAPVAADKDGDGVPDASDKCPKVKEDMDGFQDDDGCPDPDNDGDGVLDAADKCVNEPETKNGYQDEDGCPDEIPAKIKKFTGAIQGINFRVNSDALLATSNKILDQAVAVLKEFPDLKIEIQGHTDDQPIKKGGKFADNLELSQARAESVRAYFVKKGIEENRITAK
ncbi:MAG TPA: OmpA family protein, partial [Kofleriaceae bacterium]|nr:OmpA family protein [Kofleriaceae bacterium]